MAWRLRPIVGTGANESGRCCGENVANLPFQKLLVPQSSWCLHFVFFNVSRLNLWSWCSVCISLLRAKACVNVFFCSVECHSGWVWCFPTTADHVFVYMYRFSWICYPFGKISDGISQVVWPHREKTTKLHFSMPRPPPHGPSERPQANHPRSTHPLIQHLQANRICDTRASTSGGGNGGGTGNIVPPGATRALLELLL